MNSCKKKSHLIAKSIQFKLLLIVIIGVTTHICYAATIATSPLFLTSSVIPIVMLNISKDHQLYFKAYDDYSDLNNDGSPDTTYDNSINYYGYFDSYKCYSYSDISNRFEPSSTTNTKYCDGLWSGNFLNWASMTRIDTIRKILYGGLRSTDASSTATPSSSTTTTPVTTNPVITNTVTSAYVVSGPVAGNPVTISVIGTISGPNCSLPAPTSTKSAESAPSATTVGTVTNSTPVRGTATNSTPVTDTSGTTTTTTYNTTFISTYTTTQPTTYTTTHTIKVVTTAFRNGDDRNDCDNDNETADIRTTTVTTTYTTTYTSTKTDTKQTSTTSTTTATTLPANALTVLERSYLPNDAHSFAKFYKGSDLKRLTPYTSASGITLCNTTVSNTTLSQNVTDAPLLRVAMGDFSLWSANERWQCRWSQEKTASNGNVPASSGLISALANNPSNASSGSGDFNVRVKVCVNGLINTENCKTYPDGTLKPIGLLQTYGDGDLIRFGLLTGSYGKNKSGGVLRKNVSSITDEINVTTNGTFKSTPSTGGVLNTLNKLRIHGYRHDDGTYFGTTGSDNCTWGLNIFIDGNCSNWGNPQSEIFLESLRYLSNHSALTAFLPASPKTDSSYISGLTVATRNNPPISATEWCAKLNVIQFNASTSSYDHDQLGSVSDISSTAMNALTNVVGVVEGIPGTSRFVGENGTDINQLCTAKTVNNLSDVRGTCPDAPRLSGTYHVAGLAQFAHNNDIQLGLQGDQLVTTYGVALSPHVPKIVVPVPGSPTKTVTILPACQNSSVGGNCTIVDFKIVHQECNQLSPIPADSNSNCGKIYVNWEDSEQGGDFDQDEWGILTYSVNSTQVKITTKVIAQSTPYKMGFGYILSGTKKDGFHAHSGIYGYAYTDPQGTTACNNCVLSNAASSETYEIGNGSALSLQQPLFYAAKWGGFIDSNSNGIPDLLSEWDSDGNNIPDNYFYATDPSQLAKALNAAFANVVATSASASAVAANSTRLDSGTQVYQAKFNSTDWSGQLQAYNVNTSNGALSINWEASALIPNSRNIRTYNPSAAAGTRGVDFQWPNLTTPTPNPLGTSQQEYLNAGDSYGALRVDWLRGNKATEKKNGGYFRDRTNLLGDIVNSDPVYVGSEDYGYSSIDSGYSAFLARKTSRMPMLYVGANDGMMHGFNASLSGGQEVFAYIPNFVFPELSKLTSPNYVHQYYIDGMSAAGDVNYDGDWRTLLAGTTGAGGDPTSTPSGSGGRGIFVLDVTHPDSFGLSSALWEFTNTNKPDGTPNTSVFPGTPNPDGGDLGYTLAQPSIVRMQDGHWAVIVANGYNSDYGHAVLFVLDASTGAVLQKIDTGSCLGNPTNGLSSPIAVDTDNDLGVDTIYAGDLCGNLWKFDVSGSAGNWPVPNSPFFVACSTSGVSCSATDRQPITSKPSVGPVGLFGSDQNGLGIMIYFGTGKYFEVGDNGPSTKVQTFYGLWDKGSAIVDRSSLKEQTIDFEGIATTIGGASSIKPIRVVSKNIVCYSATSVGCTSSTLKNGWALNLVKPINIAEGERVVSVPIVRRDLMVFATVIPSSDSCETGGRSRLMELDALTGGGYVGAPFDVNGDGIVDSNDFVMIAGAKQIASAIDLGIGIIKTPAVVSSGNGDYKYLSSTTGQMGKVIDKPGGAPGSGAGGSGLRRSWQQLK